MSNLGTANIKFPINVISYYASSKGIDGKNCFNYWMRSKLVRIISDKPFARGDCLKLNSIINNSSGIIIDVTVLDEWAEEYPVLCFVSGRLIYNKWSKFEYKASDCIQILQPIEQILQENYSLGFILLCYGSGKIVCVDKSSNNYFDILVHLNMES